MPANPYTKFSDQFNRMYNSIADEAVSEINKNLKSGKKINKSVSDALSAVDYRNRVLDITVGTSLSVLSDNGVLISNFEGMTNWWKHYQWDGQDLTLSQTITKRRFQSIISTEINQSFRASRDWRSLAKNISDKKLISGELPRFQRDLITAARRARMDSKFLSDYKKLVVSTQNRIDQLSLGGAPNQRLKKAYQNLLNVSLNGSEQAFKNGINRAVREKARYNAERITRTESAKAYGQAQISKADADPDVQAVRWKLSSRHNVFDICDFNANADVYGLGAGVYPINAVPGYPAHPHCGCLLNNVFTIPDKTPQTKPKSWIKNLSKSKKQQLMGKKGAARFNKNPKLWRSSLINYQPKGLKPQLPSEFVD